MPVVNVNLVLDDATYAGVTSGVLELCGMAKDKNHRVRKHLPTVFDAAKDGAAKAIDIVREHKKGLLIVSGVFVVGGAIVGTVAFLSEKDKRKAKKQFGKSLQVYLDSAQNGTLTVEIIDTLLNHLGVIKELYKTESVPLNISVKQLNSLLNSIYDYTKNLAQANDIAQKNLSAPKRAERCAVVDLQNYLHFQKFILTS